MRAIALLCSILLAMPLAAQPVEPPGKKPMGFKIVTNDPDAPPERQSRWITATGSITPDTPAGFEWFAKANDIAGLTIYFDSTGGSIVGGIRLGDALRKANARVAIGRSLQVGEQPPAMSDKLPRHQLIPARGICFSSCAYAFLGGRTRLINPNAAYGVHMFWPGDQLDGILTRQYGYAEIERAQRISANLAAYIQRVGGDLQLLQLAANTPPKGAIRRLSPREILALKVAALDFSEPMLTEAGNWGLALDQKQARLATSGEWIDPEKRTIRYTLEASCADAPGFHDVRFEMAPKVRIEGGKSLALRRALLASTRNDGVLARSTKDIRALPAAFPRRISDNPNAWIGAAGAIPAAVLDDAARPAGTLIVRIEDGEAPRLELPLPIGNLPKIYDNWTAACARVARGGNAIP